MTHMTAALLVVFASLAFAQAPLEVPAKTFTGHARGIAAMTVSRDGSRALTGSEDRTLKLWDTASGKLLRTFEGHTDYLFAVALSSDARLALSGSQDGTARLWDIETGRALRVFTEGEQVFAVGFSPDGRTILTGGRSKRVTLWDRASGRILRRLEGHSETVLAAAFSPDGRRVLSGGQDKTLRLWDARTGAPIRTLLGHGHWVLSLAFAPDGRRAVSGGFDKTAMTWDLATGKPLKTFAGHTNAVLGVAMAPDGKRILTASEDKTAMVWDAATGRSTRLIRGHNGDLCCVAFAGARALTASDDGLMKAWPLERAGAFATPPPQAATSLDAAKNELGKMLFFDKRLSGDGAVSCASCHDPAKGWTDQSPVSVGVHGRKGRRNAPTLVDVGTFPVLLWDGRAKALEEQAAIPIGESNEMDLPREKAEAAIAAVPGYRPLFAAAFGDSMISQDRIVAAIASFERTLVSGPSPFDEKKLTAEQRRGNDLFFGKATCFACHSGAHLTDFQFHNIGVGADSPETDPGRFALSKAKRDLGAFRTPTVRNLRHTFPYMHDGSLKTLEEVVEFYDKGGTSPNRFDFEIKPLGLSDAEKRDLVAFLRALDGELPRVEPPVLP